MTYSVTVRNTGQRAYTATDPASFSDDLGGVLDDARYNGDGSAGVLVNGRTLTWSGALPVGGTVVVTYSFTVNDPDTGDRRLVSTFTPTGAGGACAAGTCTYTTLVALPGAVRVLARSGVDAPLGAGTAALLLLAGAAVLAVRVTARGRRPRGTSRAR